MKNLVLAIVILIWPLQLLGAAKYYEVKEADMLQSEGNKTIVRYYESGGSKDVEGACFDRIIDTSTKLLSNANSSYRLIVTPDLIEKFRRNEKGFEIIFDRPRNISVKFNEQNYQVKKIFIPMSGRFYKSHITVFFADPEYTEANQYINSEDISLKKKLEECTK